MPSDANLVLAAQATRTATFTGTALDLKTTPPWMRKFNVELLVNSYLSTTAGQTLSVDMQQSADNTNFTSIGTFDTLTATTSAQTALQSLACVPTKRYLRVVGTIGGTGSGPSFAYQARLLPATA